MKKKPSPTVVVVLFAFALLLAPCAAVARGFNSFVGFGDSTLDTGYFRYTSTGVPSVNAAVTSAIAAGAQGGFAGPGVMTSTMLAGRFGLNAAPVGGGGSNYANGATYTAPLGTPSASGELPGNVATTAQIANYLASTGGVANPHALYVVNSGNNDLLFMQKQSAAWLAANPNFLNGLASQFAGSVAALQAAGARTIIVPNTFYTSTLTGLGGVLPASNAEAYAQAVAYSNAKWSALTTAGVRFIPADLTSVFRFVSVNPALFGFTPASVLAANAPSPVAALVTSWADITPAQMQTYLFIDGKHLTTAGQQIEADYENSLLTGPGQMSLLAEGPVQDGLTRMTTIQGQIDLSGQHRGPYGINVWANAGANALNIRNTPGFPDTSGTPFTGSVGADYQLSCGLMLGAAFTAGTQNQKFSMNGGQFDQTSQAYSLYAAYKAGPVWGNVVGSYGLYQDSITRPVTLGLYTDQNTANTTGKSLALAVRAGGDIRLGLVTTGPVVGMVLQQVRINSFTESGGSGITTLSYGQQVRDSLVSQLGWRVAADVGNWKPFVEAKWNHEWADKDRMVKAAITSAAAAPYAIAADPVEPDWATGSIGVSYKINEQWMLRSSASAMLINPQVVSYGGEVGVSVSF